MAADQKKSSIQQRASWNAAFCLTVFHKTPEGSELVGDKIANVQLIIKTYLGEGSPAGLCLRKLSVATVFSPYSDAVDE